MFFYWLRHTFWNSIRDTVWMTVIIVFLCVTAVYGLLKIK